MRYLGSLAPLVFCNKAGGLRMWMINFDWLLILLRSALTNQILCPLSAHKPYVNQINNFYICTLIIGAYCITVPCITYSLAESAINFVSLKHCNICIRLSHLIIIYNIDNL